MDYFRDPINAALTEQRIRISQEESVLIQAQSLASLEQSAIEAGKRLPTFWDRYNELRQRYGLPPVQRPDA